MYLQHSASSAREGVKLHAGSAIGRVRGLYLALRSSSNCLPFSSQASREASVHLRSTHAMAALCPRGSLLRPDMRCARPALLAGICQRHQRVLAAASPRSASKRTKAAGSSSSSPVPEATSESKADSKEVSAEVYEFWKKRIDEVTKDVLQPCKVHMNPRLPMGFTQEWARNQGESVSLWNDFVSWKTRHPKDMVLIKNGSFYETMGIDAMMLVEHCGYNLMGGNNPGKSPKVPKAGFPANQIDGQVQKLNSLKFGVVVLDQVADDGRNGGKGGFMRVLKYRSTVAHPRYQAGTGLDTDTLFAQQKPLVGVSLGRLGFTLHVMRLEQETVEVHDQLTEEGLFAQLWAQGVAPPLLLHTSLDEAPKRTLRAQLSQYARDEIGDAETYTDPDPTQGFINKAKALLFDREERVDEMEFRVVTSTDRDHHRPRSLPRSTVMQLGLRGDTGVRSLMAKVLPLDAHRMCRDWMEQLLLMPPPPHMAMYLHGALRHLATTQAAGYTLMSGLPSNKVHDAITSRTGDAPFFRQLHGMLTPLVAMLADARHAPLWDNLLPYTLGFMNRGDDRLSTSKLTAHLKDCMQRIDHLIVLKTPDYNAYLTDRSGESSSGSDNDDGAAVAGTAPRGAAARSSSSSSGASGPGASDAPDWQAGAVKGATRQVGGVYNSRLKEARDETWDKSMRVLDDWFAGMEAFRWEVREEHLGPEIAAVDKAAATYRTALEELLATALQAAHNTGKNNAPVLVVSDGVNVPALYVPGKASIKVPDVVHGAMQLASSKTQNHWVSYDIQRLAEQYTRAVAHARHKARELCRGLCGQLEGHMGDLLLGCKMSVVKTALDRHAQQAQDLGWCQPVLVPLDTSRPPGPPPGARTPSLHTAPSAGGSYHEAAGPQGLDGADSGRGFQPNVCRMEVRGFWPYWLLRDSPDTIRNDVTLDRILLLTGPNMSGKSTVLRSMCAVALLANCGLFVPAEAATVPFYDNFLLRNFSGDSPVEGKSSFALEMMEMSSAYRSCTPRSLVLLDELCKGTEVGKGTAIAASIIQDWAHWGFTGVFASHLHDLVPIAEKQGLVDAQALGFKCMELATDRAGHQSSTRRLRDGVCYESLAFEVARSEGLPAHVLDRAEALWQLMQAGELGHGHTHAHRARTASRPPSPAARRTAPPAAPIEVVPPATSPAQPPPSPASLPVEPLPSPSVEPPRQLSAQQDAPTPRAPPHAQSRATQPRVAQRTATPPPLPADDAPDLPSPRITAQLPRRTANREIELEEQEPATQSPQPQQTGRASRRAGRSSRSSSGLASAGGAPGLGPDAGTDPGLDAAGVPTDPLATGADGGVFGQAPTSRGLSDEGAGGHVTASAGSDSEVNGSALGELNAGEEGAGRFSIQQAQQVLQDVVCHMLSPFYSPEELSQLVLQVVLPGQDVPVSHRSGPGVYVVRWFNGLFYGGEANDLNQRLTTHRRSPGRSLATKYRGPDTAMAYVLLPSTCPVKREAIERQVIHKLQRDGFPLSSTYDAGVRGR